MRKLWEKLGSNDAINWISVALVAVVTVLGSFALANVETEGRQSEFVAISTASMLVVAVVLWVGKQVLVRTGKPWLRPIVTSVTFVIALFLRAFTFDSLLVVFAFADQAQFLYRLVSSLLTVGGGFLISAYLVVTSREIARKRESLALVQQRLSEATSKANILVSSRKSQLLEEVRELIATKLTSQGNGGNRLRELLDDVVRPVSHRLFREFESVIQEPKPVEVKGIDWRTLLSHAMNSKTTYPLAFGVWISWTAMNMLPALSSETGQLAAAVAILIVVVTLPVLELTWRVLPAALGIWQRAAIYTGLFASFDLVLVFTLDLVSDVSLTDPMRLLATLLSVLVGAWTVSLGFAGAALLSQINLSLDEANLELRREIATLNGAARAFQERVSKLLHGPIQDTIAKALYRAELDRDFQSNPITSEIGQEINRLIDGLDNFNRNVRTVEVFLGELVQMWDGVVQIDVSLENEASLKLQEDEVTSGTVIEIVREGCSNAIRHGDATEINVTVSLIAETNQIQIKIANLGNKLQHDQVSGLGTQLFNQLCSEWSRQQLGNQVVLTCQVPLSPKNSVSLIS